MMRHAPFYLRIFLAHCLCIGIAGDRSVVKPFQIRVAPSAPNSIETEIGALQDAGYCVQSVATVEPSSSYSTNQAGILFNRRPSCPAWFSSRSSNMEEFVSRVQAASQSGYIPTQASAATARHSPASKMEYRFESFAEYARGVKAEVRLMELTSSVEEQRLANAGYQLLKLIGLNVQDGPRHMAVWVKPSFSPNQRQAHYGMSLANCIQFDGYMAQNDYTPVQFQVFGAGAEPQCAAIWEAGHPGTKYRLHTGSNLSAMVEEMQSSSLNPIQISTYNDEFNVTQFVILWTSLQPHRFPGLWEETEAPVDYLPGSRKGFRPADLAKIDRRIRKVMRKQSIMSLSYAISKNERLKLAAAYGYSDAASQKPLSTDSRFRIASISKSFTSTGIHRLIEMGRLRRHQRVFGEGAIFGTKYGTLPYSDRLKAIKLIHLLQHTEGGWSGRENDGIPDPISRFPEWTSDQLVTYVVDHYPLNFTAGSHYQYCNFGYLLLGKIIEHVTGELYEDFQQHTILKPLSMTKTHIGYNGTAKRLPNEIHYSDHDGSIYLFDMERNKGDSAWVSTAVDLLKFLSGSNGMTFRKDLLQPITRRQMLRPSAVSNLTYASGWQFGAGQLGTSTTDYGHGGDLHGLTTLMWHRDDGVEFSFLISGYSGGYTASRDLFTALTSIVDEDITHWPDYDLFE